MNTTSISHFITVHHHCTIHSPPLQSSSCGFLFRNFRDFLFLQFCVCWMLNAVMWGGCSLDITTHGKPGLWLAGLATNPGETGNIFSTRDFVLGTEDCFGWTNSFNQINMTWILSSRFAQIHFEHPYLKIMVRVVKPIKPNLLNQSYIKTFLNQTKTKTTTTSLTKLKQKLP